MIESKLDMKKYKNNFKINNSLGERVICYKNVDLWRAGNSLIEDLEFLVIGGDVDEDNIQEPYTLACKNCYDDYYCYGMWDSLEDVIKFLEK